DRVMTVSENQSYKGVKRLMTDEGLFVGISSGAVYMVATTLARKPQYAKKRIVTLFPDGGSKYLSTRVFCKETQ
ncbi:MAG: cysteine synthase A, partial [Clostridia bacterium]